MQRHAVKLNQPVFVVFNKKSPRIKSQAMSMSNELVSILHQPESITNNYFQSRSSWRNSFQIMVQPKQLIYMICHNRDASIYGSELQQYTEELPSLSLSSRKRQQFLIFCPSPQRMKKNQIPVFYIGGIVFLRFHTKFR